MSAFLSDKNLVKSRRRRPHKNLRVWDLVTASPTAVTPFIIPNDRKAKEPGMTRDLREAKSSQPRKIDNVLSESCHENAGANECTPEPSHFQSISNASLALINPNPPNHASLMGIPAEIRRMIFAHILSPYNPQGYSSMIYGAGGKDPRVVGRGHGQLCRVNRQFYNESIDLLYAQTLVFLNHETMTGFFKHRTKKQLSQMRSIHMLVRSTNWVPAIKSLVLPPETSLKIDWPISRDLWTALFENESLRYRKVEVGHRKGVQEVLFTTSIALSGPENTTKSWSRLVVKFAHGIGY